MIEPRLFLCEKTQMLNLKTVAETNPKKAMMLMRDFLFAKLNLLSVELEKINQEISQVQP